MALVARAARSSLLQHYNILTNGWKINYRSIQSLVAKAEYRNEHLPKLQQPLPLMLTPLSRNTSFFNKISAEELWKGVTSVSNAGRKRGRGKGVGKKTAKNLNKGQVIGVGKVNMLWPGLNAPIIQGKELVQQRQLPEDPDRQTKLQKMRDDMGAFRPLRLLPIERGWSGTKMPGRSIGPPDPVAGDAYDGFDTKILELKSVFNMKGNFGRKRRISVLAVTGNGNGLAGFAVGKATVGNTAVRKAKNRAGQRLMYLEQYNNHTVCHDFFTQFARSKIFVQKKPEGYGLVCHRAIKTICEVVGIKDLYAKVEGSANVQHITKAFFLGLLQQKTFENIAKETKLHVVELRKERDNFPLVVASPPAEEVKAAPSKTDPTDFNLYIMDGKVPLKKKKFPKFYELLPSWENHLSKTLRFRNQSSVRVDLRSRYGEVRSFLADKHPECRIVPFRKKTEEAEA